MQTPYQIKDKAYLLSSLGNAYFSGLTFSEVWNCVRLCDEREDFSVEEFDACVSITIALREIYKNGR